MINLAWGGLTNGEIDTSILVDVSGRGDYLEPTAAHQFLAMREALHEATDVWINPAPGSSAYRPLSIQKQFYAAYLAGTGNVAAVPGTSNHGWGRAVDITGYESSVAVWDWLLAHASAFGYSWATGQASGERWHWESLTPPGTITASLGATSIGEDMPLTNADVSLLLNYPAYTGGASISQVLKDLELRVATIGAVVAQPVLRDGKTIAQIQDEADTGTIARQIAAQIGSLQASLGALAAGQGADPAAIQAAAEAGAARALANLKLEAVPAAPAS